MARFDVFDGLPELVGGPELADLLGVPAKTVRTLRFRGSVPEPTGLVVNGGPVWTIEAVVRWAGESGRLSPTAVAGFPVRERLAVAYRELMGEEPAGHRTRIAPRRE